VSSISSGNFGKAGARVHIWDSSGPPNERTPDGKTALTRFRKWPVRKRAARKTFIAPPITISIQP